MTRHQDPPGWFFAIGPASLLVAFLVLALANVFTETWMWVAVGVVGILTSAATWVLMLNLREQVCVLKGQQVRDGYTIATLEAALKRERAWRN